MWICPKCGREFRRQNQGHYCGEPPASLEAYIAAQEDTRQPCLRELAVLIREVAPDCQVCVKWSMPSFQLGSQAVQFAACKSWISFYIGAEVISLFQDSLEGLRYKKDALYLSYDQPLPRDILAQIIRQALAP